MFSFQPRDELDFGTSTTTSQGQGYQIPHDLRMDHSLLQSNFISFSAAAANQEQLQSPRPRRAADRSRHEGGAAHVRRFMHREIERKRRQEMSTLYASLRTLLPLDHFNKGKSSVCDQMEEAEKYIKQMHKKIEELGSRRDKLKKLYISSSSSSRRENVEISADVDDTLNNCVSIHKVLHGLEILISNKSPQSKLSPVLAELVKRDLDVVSCVSTRTKGEFLHKLQIEATDMVSLDLAALHDGLIEAMKE